MSAPLVFSYYANVPDLDRAAETQLQLLWRQHWLEAGFSPKILGQRDAARHPGYYDYIDVMAKLPSINPRGYDLACYARWVAVAQVLAESDAVIGFMSDYDCFPNLKSWGDAEALIGQMGIAAVAANQTLDDIDTPESRLVCYQKCVPCFVGGRPQDFSAQCGRFVKYAPPPGTTHTSDMLILEAQSVSEPDSYKPLEVAKLWSEPGWEKAPLVHFSNSVMTPAGLIPRAKHIPKILDDLKLNV